MLARIQLVAQNKVFHCGLITPNFYTVPLNIHIFINVVQQYTGHYTLAIA